MRYFLGQDDDGHWYLVPAHKRVEFNNWLDALQDEEADPSPPAGVERLNHSPSTLTFENPR